MEKNKLETIIKSSFSYADVLRGMDLNTNNGNYQTLKRYISKYNLSIDHFKYISNMGEMIAKPIDFYLQNGTTIGSNNLKKKILKLKLIEYQCAWCKITDTYDGRPIVLQLDHINGINTDNRLENLRLLCPNCHSQTDTFTSKNRVNKISENKMSIKYQQYEQKQKDCICQCGEKKHFKSTICIKCLGKINKNKDKNKNSTRQKILNEFGLDYIIDLLKKTSYVNVGKLLNVSDNAVRKIIKSEGYNFKTLQKIK